MKTFMMLQNIGRVRHAVSLHDGVKTHKDNSPFFDIRTFSRKQDAQKFATELLAAGYSKS